MSFTDNKKVIEYINSLQGYRGYVQFSHRKIEKEKDVFDTKDPHIEEEEGFIHEAHFCNGKYTVVIRQINDQWYLSQTDISRIKEVDTQCYIANLKDFGKRVRMAQVWIEEEDELCAGMQVQTLKNVVFAGFEEVKNDNCTL